MRVLLWALVALLAMAVVAPFILKDEHGRPLMSFADLHTPKLKAPDLPELPDIPLPFGKDDGRGEAMTAYKWQDADGTWHFSDTEPAAEAGAETIEVEAPTVMAEPPPGQDDEAPAAEGADEAGEEAGNLMQRARKAAGRMKERNDALKELMGADAP